MSLRSPTRIQLVCPRVCPSGHEHLGGRAGSAGDGDDRCIHGGRISELHAERNRQQRASGPDAFSNYSTEIGLAATPNQLVDRINLLLMAGEMDSTLRGQILSAVNSIAIPSSGQNAINAALLPAWRRQST